jgi:hypothetical protein
VLRAQDFFEGPEAFQRLVPSDEKTNISIYIAKAVFSPKRERMTRVNMIDCDLEGRVILMTGADRGLGRAKSLGLAEKGAGVTARGRYSLSDAFAAARQRFVSRALHI